MVQFECKLCPYVALSKTEFNKHVVKRHKDQSGLVISCNYALCGKKFSNYKNYLNHFQRVHHLTLQEDPALSFDVDNTLDCGQTFDVDESIAEYRPAHTGRRTCMENTAKAAEAALLLRMTTKHKLSQNGLADVVKSTANIFQNGLLIARQKLISEGVGEDILDEAFGELTENMFSTFESKKERNNFYTSCFNLVQPEQLTIGWRRFNERVGGKYRYRETPVKVYYVPFLKQLKALISIPEVLSCIIRADNNFSSMMQDASDGMYLKAHEGYRKHPGALLFSIYSDDFEIVNPIGAYRKKHKITVYYWTLLNIPPEHRSKLRSIQLLCMGRKPHLDEFQAHDKMLTDFQSAMNNLSDGITLDINGNNRLVYGYLLFAVGDTPAAQAMGGFKEGVGGAEKPCRTCNVSRTELVRYTSHSDCPLRSKEDHNECLRLLSLADRSSFTDLSKEFGVNKETFLNSIPHFDVTKCILQDPMHILLEGVVKTELKSLLLYLDDNNILSLAKLNRWLRSFEYSPEERLDRPQMIERKHLSPSNNLPQTAGSIKVLLNTLPFLIGSLVSADDDPRWKNFLRLVQIVQLTLSTIASADTISELRFLIADHLLEFSRLYPNVSITPKMHYMIHLPEQLRLFGPLKHHWCMRFEGKNGFFKQKRWFNFKNLPSSLSHFHQKWMCLAMINTSGQRSKTYLCEPSTVKPCSTTLLMDLPEKDWVHLYDADCSDQEVVIQAREATMHGITYRTGDILLSEFCGMDYPKFLEIILLIKTKKLLYIRYDNLETVNFCSSMNAFHVKKNGSGGFEPLCAVSYKWPQIKHHICGVPYVMLRDIDSVWSL